MISTSHIGSLLLPGSSDVVNTTFNVTINTPPSTSISPSNSISSTTSCNTSTTLSNTSTCPADHTAVVGGTVGGVLGAALIASLVALLLTIRSRRKYKSGLSAASAAIATAETHAAEDKAHFHNQYATDAYSYTPSPYGQSPGKTMSYAIVEMPGSGHSVNELDDPNNSRSELTAEQRKSTHSYAAKRSNQ